MPVTYSQDKTVVDALSALTIQLQKLNTYLDNQESKTERARVMGHPDQTEQQQQPRGPLPYTFAQLQKEYQQARIRTESPYGTVGRPTAMRDAFANLGEPQRKQPVESVRPGSVGASASVPSDVGGKPMGQYSGSQGGLPSNPNSKKMSSISDNDALTLSVLGEHGGPQMLRNMALESYGLQKNIKWAQNAAKSTNAQNWAAGNAKIPFTNIGVPGIGSQNLAAINGALTFAQKNPAAAYAAYKGVTGAMNIVSGINDTLKGAQQYGQQFGYGAPAGGNTIFGFRNPLGDFTNAASAGMAANAETQALQGRIPGMGFGSGMTGQQAQQTMSTLAGQGFSMNPMGGGPLGLGRDALNIVGAVPGIGGVASALLSGLFGNGPTGTAANIASNLFKPEMQQYGSGLTADDLSSLTPYLRNSGTSIAQLKQTINDLGTASKATNETVGQTFQAMVSFNEMTQGMGTDQGGMNAAQGFRNDTGLDPQILGQLMQNPLMQGLTMGQYGVLPSGQKDLNPGALTGTSMQAVSMMMGMTKGLNRNVIDPRTGQVLMSGKTAQEDQVAQYLGLNPSQVKYMVANQRGIQARAATTQYSTEFQNMMNAQHQQKGGMTNAQRIYDQQFWNKYVAPTWQHTGIGKKEMAQLGTEGFDKRLRDLKNDLNRGAGQQSSQIQNNSNAQTFQITLSGAAKKLFNISGGPSPNKRLSNAGQTSITGTVNAPTGDMSNPATGAGGAVGPTSIANMYG